MSEGLLDEYSLLIGLNVLLGLVFLTGAAILYHAGAFSSIIIRTCRPMLREVKIAYKYAEGNYNDAGYMFTEAHSILPNKNAIAVYYSNPNKRSNKKLQYIVGLVVGEKGESIKPEEERLLIDHSYKFATFPAVDHAVQSSFPFYNSVSIIFAVRRVYPALAEYIGAKTLCAHPYIEYYNNSKNEIVFIAPLERQEKFYVPEITAEDNYETEDDDQSSFTADRSDIYRCDESYSEDDGSFSNLSTTMSPMEEMLPPLPEESHSDAGSGTTTHKEEDSDHTDSSYEKIDRTEVNSV